MAITTRENVLLSYLKEDELLDYKLIDEFSKPHGLSSRPSGEQRYFEALTRLAQEREEKEALQKRVDELEARPQYPKPALIEFEERLEQMEKDNPTEDKEG